MNRATVLLTALFGFLLIVSRVPLMPGQIFSEDEVNFAYAIGELDTRIGQPQPPGYPVFVLEARLLDFLRFKRPESNLQALAYLASAASLALIVVLGNRMFGSGAGQGAGWWSAGVLLFYPTFWFGALTSAVRVHLAVVSLGVAWTCWRLLEGGGRRWLYASTLALGIGSGMRPELGPLLLPLWLWCVWRGERTWNHRFLAGSLLTACVVSWVSFVALASGGFGRYFKNTWAYLNDHVALAPTVGAEDSGAITIATARLLAWVFPLVPALVLPAMMAGWRTFSRRHLAFLALWVSPLLAFAAWVHLADPGHALAMVPIVCLAGGALIARGVQRWDLRGGWRESIAILTLAAALAVAMFVPHAVQLSLIVGAGLFAGLLLTRTEPAPRPSYPGLALLAPALCLSVALFLQGDWRAPQGPPLWHQINRQVLGVNKYIIDAVIGMDHRTISQAMDWVYQKPDNAIVVWMGGPTHWRKVAYYMRSTPVYVLTPAKPVPGSPMILEVARAGRTKVENKGDRPLVIRATRGSRVIFMIAPPRPVPDGCIEEGVCWMDVPHEPGSYRIGSATIEW